MSANPWGWLLDVTLVVFVKHGGQNLWLQPDGLHNKCTLPRFARSPHLALPGLRPGRVHNKLHTISLLNCCKGTLFSFNPHRISMVYDIGRPEQSAMACQAILGSHE